jgi:hypothetical protein
VQDDTDDLALLHFGQIKAEQAVDGINVVLCIVDKARSEVTQADGQ